MILPPLQVPVPTIGSTTACDCGGSGSGTKSQSPAHVSATGRCAILPTLNCRMRAASSALSWPSPVTSQASCCVGSSVRCRVMCWRMYAASSGETACPKSLSFAAATCQCLPAPRRTRSRRPWTSASRPRLAFEGDRHVGHRLRRRVVLHVPADGMDRSRRTRRRDGLRDGRAGRRRLRRRERARRGPRERGRRRAGRRQRACRRARRRRHRNRRGRGRNGRRRRAGQRRGGRRNGRGCRARDVAVGVGTVGVDVRVGVALGGGAVLVGVAVGGAGDAVGLGVGEITLG